MYVCGVSRKEVGATRGLRIPPAWRPPQPQFKYGGLKIEIVDFMKTDSETYVAYVLLMLDSIPKRIFNNKIKELYYYN